ncbi:unnamed protein product [Polarella glacialis]|uniref:RING-type domain-containing protein n=2 Tax=Polarella glacialis TaxID=89957 RepID=A0A813KZB6_POLGL|nr:unnamed protein product [Polarella glacialis]
MADSEVACPVCMLEYNDPQLLASCGHTFCKRCVAHLRPCLCPLCRVPFQSRDVRPNYALARMLSMLHGQAAPSAPAPESHRLQAVVPLVSQALSGLTLTGQGPDLARSLARQGVPFGIAQLISDEDSQIALRVFLLDNSGSTATFDGKYLSPVSGSTSMQVVPCSRWEELCQTALRQASWNLSLGIPCEFVLLNPPGGQRGFGAFREGVDLVTVDPRSNNAQAQLAALQRMLQSTRPSGLTPLLERIQEIQARLSSTYSHLVSQGGRFVLAILTDGVPTSAGSGLPPEAAQAQVAAALRHLTTMLPVFVVVRLCTDDSPVVEYYNNLDEEEELPLEVIDDLESEAREVAAKGNSWLTYSPLIHTLREGGTLVKLLDLLDERTLTPLEVRLLVGHLLQKEDEPSLPLSDPDAFFRQAGIRLKQAPLVYDPLRQAMMPCVDMKKLRPAMRPAGHRGTSAASACGCFAAFRGLLRQCLSVPCFPDARQPPRHHGHHHCGH